MGQHDPVLARAIENVRMRYSVERWLVLTPTEQTQAIYAELRRLDLARLKAAVSQTGRKEKRPTYEVA